MGTQVPPEGHSSPPPIFSPCLLWPNRWMDQDATWCGDRPRPRRHYVGWTQGAQHAQLFGPCLLWPNCWMDQDATWYRGRPLPRPHCIRWGLSPRKGHSSPPTFGPCLMWPNGRTSQQLLSSCFETQRCRYSCLKPWFRVKIKLF